MSCRRRVPLQEGQPCIQRDEPAGAPAASPAPGAGARGAGASTPAAGAPVLSDDEEDC
jgi:hypothetical protein